MNGKKAGLNVNKSPFRRPGLAAVYLITAGIMFALKRHYSNASADQLLWILKPVAWFVTMFETQPYTWQPDTGFVRADQMITIAPACAGMNFLIMAFGLPVAAFAHRQYGLIRQWTLCLWALAGAYVLAIMVNALRIIIAIALYDAHIAWSWLTPERLHRMAGICVYFSALGLYYALWHRIIAGKASTPAIRRRWLPWLWYITGAVAVPVAHQLYRGKTWPGMEYCLTVIGTSLFIFGLAKTCLYLIQPNENSGISQCIQRSSS